MANCGLVITQDLFLSSGCSAAGSAPRSGRGGPGFESRHPDHGYGVFNIDSVNMGCNYLKTAVWES